MNGCYLIDSRNFNNLIANNQGTLNNNTDQKMWTKKKESGGPSDEQAMTVSDPYNELGTLNSYRKTANARSTIAEKYKTE